ncbi:MAG: ParB/RepB/Spo0J family partition protein [Planctomycetes bacterium]|nr:ParB/RepB/Spo0J family partition protein [Planctomycetota bacterium]
MAENSGFQPDDERADARPKRGRLGRGMSALLGASRLSEPSTTASAGEEQSQVPIAQIDQNPFQPRQDFEQKSLDELAHSIGRHGILQPILVRRHCGRFQLIAGERRLRAARQAGLAVVPCRILELEDQLVCEVAIEENLKRKDLGVLEKAQAFREYIDRFDSSIEDLAGRLGMNRSTVSNFLRLLELPEPVLQSIRAERISNGHARALLPLDDEDRIALCRRIEKESLSVRKTEQAVKEIVKARTEQPAETVELVLLSEEEVAAESISRDHGLSPHLASVQDQLRQLLGLKVDIQVRGKESGRIVIPFNCNDDFEIILRTLRRAA